MSRTPLVDEKHAPKKEVEDYRRNFQAFAGLLRSGRSLSGNERNCVFLNVAGRRFADVSSISGLDFPDDSRAVALTDWDRDGDLDCWLLNRTRPRIRFLRNDVGANHHFLVIRLVGKSCNRDAIGARVEVKQAGESRTLIRSVRAGGGFATQSSKWLHFGLGDNPQIEQVVVHWPGGLSQTLHDLQTDRHYILTQGDQTATVVPPSTQSQSLSPSDQVPTPRKSERLRVGLFGHVPLPSLRYRTWDRRLRRLEFPRKKPLLINVWASWCAPCLAELSELTKSADKIQAAGVDVLALTIDGAQNLKSEELARSQAFVTRIEFPFESGLATVDVMKRLDLFQQPSIEGETAALPTSLLVTPSGNVAAIYRGRLDVASLLSDVGRIQRAEPEPADLALAFPGRWFARPSPRDQLITLAALFLLRNYPRQSLHYSRRAVQIDPQSELAKRNFDIANGKVTALAKQAERFLAQIAAKPDDPQAHLQLAQTRLRQGEIDAAIRHFEKAVDLDPNSTDARLNLGQLLADEGDLERAEKHFQQLLRIQPGHERALRNLKQIKATRANPVGPES